MDILAKILIVDSSILSYHSYIKKLMPLMLITFLLTSLFESHTINRLLKDLVNVTGFTKTDQNVTRTEIQVILTLMIHSWTVQKHQPRGYR